MKKNKEEQRCLHSTRRERLKSALYLKLKKRKTFFWKKNFFGKKLLEKKFCFAKCRSAEKKIKRGGPLVSAGFVGYVKKVKNARRDFWRQKNFRKKVTQ